MARIPSFRVIATVVFSLGMIILGGINVREKRVWLQPVDGVQWVGEGAVRATFVSPDGPGARAGLEAGDVLVSIDAFSIERDIQVVGVLADLGAWAQATYGIERDGNAFETRVVLEPRADAVGNRLAYLEVVGILYLLVGLLVVTNRWRAPHATHFYLVSIVSFVLYVFYPTGKFDDLDWAVYWSDLVASLLLPALFMHFVIEFPQESGYRHRYGRLLPLLYLPGALLLVVDVAVVLGAPMTRVSPLVLRDAL
jgi:hypothetical protein